MNESMELALSKANELSGRPNYGGMASVRVQWHPYEREWQGIADWSSNRRITGVGETPAGALNALLVKLDEALAKRGE